MKPYKPTIVRIESRMKLKELLQLPSVDPNNILICNCSQILDTSTIPDEYVLYNLRMLTPTPSVINIYISEGDTDAYVVRYMKQLNKPECAFMMNEMLRIGMIERRDLAFVCHADEAEFGFIRMIEKYMDDTYGIPGVSFKKYKGGKRSKWANSVSEVIELVEETREELMRKMQALDIELPVMLMRRFTKSELKKNLPKDFKKAYKQVMSGEKEFGEAFKKVIGKRRS